MSDDNVTRMLPPTGLIDGVKRLLLDAEMQPLPEISQARLPAIYQEADQALRMCVEIDECRDWADRAAALASYARQADNRDLEAMARRIRLRAVRRCGELLAEIKAQGGRRTDLEPRDSNVLRLPTRTAVASAVGLSDRQRKTALRLAAVPTAEFEAAVEAAPPATVTLLAERGMQLRPATSRQDRVKAELAVLMAVWDAIAFEDRLALVSACRRASIEARDLFLIRSGLS